MLLHLVYTYGVDLGGESVEIDEEIYSSVGKCAHASLVVTVGVHVVDADRIGSQSLHEFRIVAALVVVDQRVIGSELVGDTCSTGSATGGRSILGMKLPLMKNCLPSLVKNLAPLAVIVGMAETEAARAATASVVLRRISMVEGGEGFGDSRCLWVFARGCPNNYKSICEEVNLCSSRSWTVQGTKAIVLVHQGF